MQRWKRVWTNITHTYLLTFCYYVLFYFLYLCVPWLPSQSCSFSVFPLALEHKRMHSDTQLLVLTLYSILYTKCTRLCDFCAVSLRNCAVPHTLVIGSAYAVFQPSHAECVYSCECVCVGVNGWVRAVVKWRLSGCADLPKCPRATSSACACLPPTIPAPLLPSLTAALLSNQSSNAKKQNWLFRWPIHKNISAGMNPTPILPTPNCHWQRAM